MGHYASECPETLEDAQRMLNDNTETGTNMLHHATTFDPTTTSRPHHGPINDLTTERKNEMNFASLDHDDKQMEDNDTSFVFVQDVRNVEMQHGGHLPPEWILLDNQSTVDVFTNRHLLKNI